MLAPIEYSLGEKIKFYREQKGLTQKQLADVCGITDTAIRNYEKGIRTPDEETLRKIRDELDISYYTLTGKYDPLDPNAYAHFIMESSFLYNARPVEIDGKFGLIFEDGLAPESKKSGFTCGETISLILQHWIQSLKDYEDGKISEEQYHIWISNFPASLLSYNKKDFSEENILKTLGIE